MRDLERILYFEGVRGGRPNEVAVLRERQVLPEVKNALDGRAWKWSSK